jgi:hypothetical protein
MTAFVYITDCLGFLLQLDLRTYVTTSKWKIQYVNTAVSVKAMGISDATGYLRMITFYIQCTTLLGQSQPYCQRYFWGHAGPSHVA